MRPFDLIVFDWDGTLMDSAGMIAKSIQSACREMGYPAPDAKRARQVIGLSLSEAIAAIAPELPPHEYPRIVECYHRHYLTMDQHLKLFNGVKEMLEELTGQNLLLAIATGKSRQGLDRALEQTGLARYFHALRTADRCASKPHPQMLLELMEELGIPKNRTLMIGDTTHDLLMAQNAGVAYVGVDYGAHTRTALLSQEPLACVSSVAKLRAWLRQHHSPALP